MFCVNPENGFLALKALAPDNTCLYTSLYTVQDISNQSNLISSSDVGLIFAAVCSAYGLVFIIKLVLQLLGYRHG
ncbi:hypothetical protein FR271_21960 [Vibrio vulnificus]|nr:hypothetical protein [Vibrio vulnificus]EGR0093617.1 hypothetical protein [Vibrio vulnificus]EIJ0948490.1 hypothetical protein [Vibrio vulnificus]